MGNSECGSGNGEGGMRPPARRGLRPGGKWDPSSSDRAGLPASHKDTKLRRDTSGFAHKDTKLRRDKMPRLKMRNAEKMTTGGHVDAKILPGAVLLKANSAALLVCRRQTNI